MVQKNIFQIEDTFSIAGRGTIIAGTLISGQLQKGMRATINGKSAVITQVEQQHKTLESVSQAGSKLGVSLSNVDKNDITLGSISFE